MEQRHSNPPPRAAGNQVTASTRGGAVAVTATAGTTPSLSIALAREVELDFAMWFKKNTKRLYGYAYLFCKDKAFAEDLVQEVAAKLFRTWGDEARRGLAENFTTYAYSVVKNAYLDYAKKPSRTNQSETELSVEIQEQMRVNVTLDLETIQTLREAVRHLDENERLMIYLVYYQDTNVSAAGRDIGLTTSQADRMHKSALKNLRSILGIG